jgi:hypothetical protein
MDQTVLTYIPKTTASGGWLAWSRDDELKIKNLLKSSFGVNVKVYVSHQKVL